MLQKDAVYARKLLACLAIVLKCLVVVFLACRPLSGFVLIFWLYEFLHGEHRMLFKIRPISMSSKALSTKVLLTFRTPTDSWWLAFARATSYFVWSTLYRQYFKHFGNEIISCHICNLLSFFQFKLCSTIRTAEQFNHFSLCLFTLAFHELLQATFTKGMKTRKRS